MFSFVSLDAKTVAPVVVIALAGIAAWFLWTRAKRNQAQAAAADASAATYNASSLAVNPAGTLGNLALLSALFGSNATGTAATGTAAGQVTYTAPTPSTTGSNAAAAVATPAAAAVTSGSSSGNTTVSQGV